jgi:quinol-cytochrome oxidoreductase complex cytochrome b subunit
MVIFTGLHMIRVYVSSAYAPPRRLNWIIGVALLVLTLFIDFTGYLLVWDSRSFWAWTIARNLAEHVPLMGSFMAAILFGGPDPSDYVLVRIYTWHVFLLPQIILILAALHFWKVRKDGISVPL